MNCKHIESRLSAFIDQELSRAEHSQVRAHIHDCEACAVALAQLTQIKNLMAARPEVEVPLGFEDRLVCAVFEQPTRAPRRFVLAWAGTAAFAIAFVGAWGYLQSSSAEDSELRNQMAKSDFNLARDQAYAAGGDPFAGNTVILTSTHGAH